MSSSITSLNSLSQPVLNKSYLTITTIHLVLQHNKYFLAHGHSRLNYVWACKDKAHLLLFSTSIYIQFPSKLNIMGGILQMVLCSNIKKKVPEM